MRILNQAIRFFHFHWIHITFLVIKDFFAAGVNGYLNALTLVGSDT
jgi:hypothetical protein